MSVAQPIPHQELDSLYSCHHGWLRGWLRRRVGCSEQAADLAQDTFLRLLNRPRALAELKQPRSYLATVARGLVINCWQRQELERAWLDSLRVLAPELTPSLEEQQLALESLERVLRMLEGLPQRVAEIFVLSQIDGLSYPAIAGQLGISVNVVQKAMLKAARHCYAVIYDD